MGRGQAVHPGGPGLGGEVFQVQPQGTGGARGHARHEGLGQVAGQGLDDHLAGLDVGQRRSPASNLHAVQSLGVAFGVDLRTDAAEGGQVVHPQSHRDAMLARQLPGQTPGHADVAVVVDDGAENVPGHGVEEVRAAVGRRANPRA
jgi:hypothetical protein